VDKAYKPRKDRINEVVADLKKKIGDHLIRERSRQAYEYQNALAAHAAGDHVAAVSALAVASEATTQPVAGTTLAEEWVAEVIAPDLMTREWLVPDYDRINAHAKTTPINQEPFPIAGVKFTKKPKLSMRREVKLV
jgi:hypothetical protein